MAVRTPEEKKREIADADALLRMPCNREDIAAGKRLHWIQQGSVTVAGCSAVAEHTSVRQEVPQKLLDGTVVVTNLQGVLTRPLAEHAIAMMMALGRALDINILQQAKGISTRPRFRRTALGVRRAHLAGGRAWAASAPRWPQIAHGLGMTVIATNPSSRQVPGTVSYVGLPANCRTWSARPMSWCWRRR